MAFNKHTPGLRIQEYFETLQNLIKEGKVTGMSGLRNGIYLSLHSAKYSDVVLLQQPPNALIKTTAFIGKILGYKI